MYYIHVFFIIIFFFFYIYRVITLVFLEVLYKNFSSMAYIKVVLPSLHHVTITVYFLCSCYIFEVPYKYHGTSNNRAINLHHG